MQKIIFIQKILEIIQFFWNEYFRIHRDECPSGRSRVSWKCTMTSSWSSTQADLPVEISILQIHEAVQVAGLLKVYLAM